MLKQFFLLAMTATLVASVGFASQSNTNVTIPVKYTSPSSGKQMYVNYCAPCHGVDGRGSGPVASALKVKPADLTTLNRNHQGRYPESHVATVLQSGAIASHGSAQMPVWGPILGSMNGASPQDRPLRISNLSRYLETLQAK
jgi:mono/diheme cytochrome c family protein